MKLKDLTKDDIKNMTAVALLDVVAALELGPVSLVLPILGNIVLSMKESGEWKKQIEALENSQKEQIKRELERIYEKLVAEKNVCAMEMRKVDALELFFRGELSEAEFQDINDYLSMYRSKGISLDNEEYCNGDYGVIIDSYYLLTDRIGLDLVDPCEKESVMKLVDLIDRMLNDVSGCNEVKKILFY